jgi:hypothetical protein
MARKLPLPRGWKHSDRSSVLHILVLGHYSVRPGRSLDQASQWHPSSPGGTNRSFAALSVP